MIRGVVTPARQARIRIVVRGTAGRATEVEAVIDTGFNDFLTLPPALVAALRLLFAAPTQATLGDGSVVVMNYYRATVVWDGVPRNVLGLAAEDGPLVGMSLLYGYDLYIQAIDGGTVTIKRSRGTIPQS